MSGFWQASKFLLSGLITNLSVYLAYLLLNVAGLGHKTAMTLTFAAGMLLSFHLNRRWTFAHQGEHPAALTRFITAYAAAYCTNLASLWFFVDNLGFRHYFVQAGNIAVISALLFAAQKYWIFNPAGNGAIKSCAAKGAAR